MLISDAHVKLMFANGKMAQIAVLVLDWFDNYCADRGFKKRLEILLNTCGRLLPAAPDFTSLYLALWLKNRDARVYKILPVGEGIERTEPRCLFPNS